MEEFLSGLGWMSIQAGCVVIVVLMVRFLFGRLRVPKKYAMLLWLVPYLCMICPWKIESDYGFWRQPGEYRQDWVYSAGVLGVIQDSAEPAKGAGYEQDFVELPGEGQGLQMPGHSEGWQQMEPVKDWQSGDNPENWQASDMQNNEASQGATNRDGEVNDGTGSLVAADGFGDVTEDNLQNSFQGAERVAPIVFAIWMVGVLGIVIYSVISYVRLKKKLLCSVKLRENIYIADDIQVPFVLGIIRSKIYLPGGMSKENQLYVLAHENTHIRRRDPLWKLTALLITAVHWFNPLAWIALHFTEKDMEMTCDEETVLRLGLEQKQAYAMALLQLSAGRKFALGAPLAFGEGNVKGRIQNIVKYKKTLGVISVLAVVLVAVLAMVFMSSSSTCELQDVEEEWSVFQATDDRVSVVMEGERTEFPSTYCVEFSEFFLELEVARNPINKSRSEDRDKDIAIGFEDERFYYLSADCTEIWSDNRVKPGYSYRVQNPREVKDFLERMLGSVTEAEEAEQGNDKSQNGQEEIDKAEQGNAAEEDIAGSNMDLPEGAVQVAIPKPFMTEDIHEGAAGVFLDYASEERIVFHDYYGLFVYDREKGLIGEIDLSAIGMEMIQGSNAWDVQVTADGSRLYMHGMEDEDMYVYDVELNHLYRCEKYDVSGIDMFRGLLDTQACVEPDYTVARSWHCVKVGEHSYHYLESGSGLPIDMCWVIRQYPQTEKETEEYIKIFDSYEGEWSTLYSDARHEIDVEKNLNKQLELIASQKWSWMMDTAFDLENYCFAVTDLDNNGRLEIIESDMHGWGQASENEIFEVSEDYEKLIRVKTNYAEGESQPDVLAGTITAYRDEKGIHYIVYDYSNKINEGTYESYYSLQFINGQIIGNMLCRKSTEFKQGKGLVTTYYDAKGETVTEEEYNQMVEKTFRNAYQYQVNIGWQDVAEYDDVSEQELVKALRASLNEFSIREMNEETESVVGGNVEELPSASLPAFTMEDLIALCKEEKVGETMQNYTKQDGFLPENFEKQQGVEGALTYTYSCLLPYGDKEYRFSASYWKAELAQEYGHAPDQLDMVHLRDIATDDLILLYSEEPQYTVNLDIEGFLSREYDIEKYMTLDLPEGACLGNYSVTMQDIFEGSLILGEFEEIQHGEWAPLAWYAPGGVGVTGKKMLEELATFEDGKLVEFHWYGNHLWGEKVETLENCELPAVLYEYNFDVFTLPELDEYARENNIAMDQVKSVSDYWYVFFAEPDGEYVYTVFLNQAYFSKEDIIELAQSVKFQ